MSRPNRRRAVRAVAPVAGLLAAGLLVWQGSYAAFSATTNSPTNAWTTGSVSLANNTPGSFSQTGVAAFTVSNMVPSATAQSKCITVRSNGNVAGAVKLFTQNVTASVVGTNQLSSNILVTVDEMKTGVTASNVTAGCGGFSSTGNIIPSTALSTIGTTYTNFGSGVGTWTTAGTGPTTPEYAAYRITYVFNPGTAVADVQGKTANADFVWEIQTP